MNNGELSTATKRYASVLQVCALVGIALLFITFLLYAFSILPSEITPEKSSELWELSAEEYREATGISAGWGWLKSLFTSRALSFFALNLVALVTIVALLSVLPTFLAERNYWYTAISILQIIVLVGAATGFLVLE